MNELRDRIYLSLMNMAVRIAPSSTREAHQEIVSRGMAAMHEALDARIAASSENPR